MDEIAETQAALRETIDNEKQRLVNARQIREFLRKQLDVGIVPDHYRIEWLQKSALTVIATLGGIADAFNRAYPLDKVTATDLVDILNNTKARIIAHANDAGG